MPSAINKSSFKIITVCLITTVVVHVADLTMLFTCENQILLSSMGSVAIPIKNNATAHINEMKLTVTATNFAEETDSTPDTVEDRFNEIWSRVQSKLCPSMVPNDPTGVGKKLFNFARKELGLPEKERYPVSNFRFDAGGFIFNNGKGKPIIYLRIYKAANDQIRFWSRKHLTDERGKFEEAESLRELFRGLRTTLHKQACVVTAIRDPIAHFISGYNEIETRIQLHPSRIEDPHPLLFTRFRNGTTQRFEKFVTDFIDGSFYYGSSPMGVGVDPTRIQMGHVYSMTGILVQLSKHNLKLTSYLPTLANLTNDWPKFMAETCPGSIPGNVVMPMEKRSMHETEFLGDTFGFRLAAKQVWKEEGEIARALCAIHALDYACYKDLPDGIPLICRKVFSSPAFLDLVMK